MFTGIIEEIGAVSARNGAALTVLAQRVIDGVAIGDSIAIDGACMTVAEFSGNSSPGRTIGENDRIASAGAMEGKIWRAEVGLWLGCGRHHGPADQVAGDKCRVWRGHSATSIVVAGLDPSN